MSNQSKPNNAVASLHAETNSPRYLTAPKICHNPNCGFQTHEPLHRCPKCGRPMWTANEFRLISGVLVFCGLFLSALGGGLIIVFANSILNSGESGASQFKGSEATLIFIFGIFGVILAFGLSALTAGVWQVIFGRANARLIYILLTLMLALLLIIWFGRFVVSLLES